MNLILIMLNAGKKVSKECISFIKQLLEKNAKKRMVIGDALKHPWFKKFIKKK